MSEQAPEDVERYQPEADEVRKETGGGATVSPQAVQEDGSVEVEESSADGSSGTTSDEEDERGDQDPRDEESDEERRRREEEFAREHDPADHDVAAGEEFRQPGDWVGEGGETQELTTEP